MKKSFRILTSAVIALLMLVSLIPMAGAATITANATTTLTNYLSMKTQANVPNVTFSFSIAPGTAVAADKANDRPTVYAGLSGAKLKYGSTTDTAVKVKFAPGDTTYNTVAAGDTVTLAAGEKYAKKTVTVDVSGVNFPQPGIYRYVITEGAETNGVQGVTNDALTTRILDVYVVTDDAGKLSIAGYVLHRVNVIMENVGGEYAEKDNGFDNHYTTYDLTISKDIQGNMGYRKQYFSFTVKLSRAVPGTVYNVDVNSAGTGNATQLIADASGNVTAHYSLTDNESITIRGITSSTTYQISEDSLDYYPQYKIDGGTAVMSEGMATDSALGDTDHTVAFTNTRESVTPTGVITDILPYAALLLAGVFGAAIMIRRKKSAATK